MRYLILALFLVGCSGYPEAEFKEEFVCKYEVIPTCINDGSRCINSCGVKFHNIDCYHEDDGIYALDILGVAVEVIDINYCDSIEG